MTGVIKYCTRHLHTCHVVKLTPTYFWLHNSLVVPCGPLWSFSVPCGHFRSIVAHWPLSVYFPVPCGVYSDPPTTNFRSHREDETSSYNSVATPPTTQLCLDLRVVYYLAQQADITTKSKKCESANDMNR